MKSSYTRTEEQEKFINEVLGIKNKAKKYKVNKINPMYKKLTPQDYARNCVWWIKEYLDGNTTKDQFDAAVKSLQTLSNKL